MQIGPGQRGVLMTFGAVHDGVLDPGLHLKLPFAQSVARMDVQVQNSQAAETSASLDLQNVSTTVATNWHILPADAEWVYQHIGDEPALVDKIIRPGNQQLRQGSHRSLQRRGPDHPPRRRCAIRSRRRSPRSCSPTGWSSTPSTSRTSTSARSSRRPSSASRSPSSAPCRRSTSCEQAKVLAQQRIVEAQAQSQAQKLLQQTLTPRDHPAAGHRQMGRAPARGGRRQGCAADDRQYRCEARARQRKCSYSIIREKYCNLLILWRPRPELNRRPTA